MIKIALYPGTFDPITFGHIDVIKKGLKLFDKIVIAVSDVDNKKYLFNSKERIEIYQSGKKPIHSLGKVEGHISPLMKGKNGFGYDPIFIPFGKKITFGEMKPFQKYKIDHRYKAFKKIKKFF